MRPAQDFRTVVVGLGEEPDVLVQDFSARHASWAVLSTLMLKLVRYDDAWRAWPELAERIPTVANGGRRVLPDGRTELRWRLRPGLTWHDGAPVTASDALFTYELLRATPPPYPHHTIIAAIDEMLVPPDDPLTLVVRWRAGADAAFAPHEEWGTVLPRHLLGDAGLHDPRVRDAHPFLRAPVFHGPYRFVEWVPGSHITVEAAGAHPRGRPRIERIVFRFYAGPEELAKAVIAGEVDVTDLTGFTAADVAAIEEAAPEVETLATPSLLWEHIDLNLDDPVLADRRVRHALAYAIDRAELSAVLYGGRQPAARSWLPDRHPAYHPDLPGYDHDPVRAGALLTEAGYPLGPDGTRRTPAGEPLSLHLLTTEPAAPGGRWNASALRPRAAALLRAQLAGVGVDLRVETAVPDVAFPRFRKRAFPQLAMFAWSMGLETTGYLMWHSAKIPDQDEWYGINVSGWRCPENDAILDRIAGADDERRIHQLMREQQAIWARELPALPLFFPVSLSTRKPGLAGIRPVGVFGAYVTWNAWAWCWEGR